MLFPKLPYSPRKTVRGLGGFSGINLSENTKDGQLERCKGLSSRLFPHLTVRPEWEALDGDSGVDAVFSRGDTFAVCKEGKLYINGEMCASVLPGSKQFAVVNTQLVIWPDKLTVDLETLECQSMEAAMALPVSAQARVTGDSIKASLVYTPVCSNIKEQFTGYLEDWEKLKYIYVYGSDRQTVENCFKNGAWQNLENYRTNALFLPSSQLSWETVSQGDIFIPCQLDADKLIFATVQGVHNTVISGQSQLPDTSLYNSEGYYGVITKTEDRTQYFPDGDEYYRRTVVFDVYKVGDDKKLFSESFAVGDAIDISGTPHGLADIEKAVITAIDGGTNTVHFADGTLSKYAGYYVLENMLEENTALVLGSSVQVERNDGQPGTDNCAFTVNLPYRLISGTVLVYEDSKKSRNERQNEKLYIWDPEKKEVKSEISVGVSFYHSDESFEYDGYLANCYDLSQSEITLKRSMPSLDFICEKDNRLWGVSNQDSTIYASALGLPRQFYDYSGLSTDSYAAAVSRDGDFTAICAYSGAVLCFKEDRLYKVLGDYPSQYYISESSIGGVEKGSEKSLQIINEVLYFKGKGGVYTYSGGTPRLISYNLGTEHLKNAVAGADKDIYHISAQRENGSYVHYVYDIIHGLWLIDGERKTDCFASREGELCFVSGGKIYSPGTDTVNTQWMAQLRPITEDTFYKKDYGKLILQLKLRPETYIKVFASWDEGLWQQVFTKRADGEQTLAVPLPIRRCNSLQLRIEGKGGAELCDIFREFKPASVN